LGGGDRNGLDVRCAKIGAAKLAVIATRSFPRIVRTRSFTRTQHSLNRNGRTPYYMARPIQSLDPQPFLGSAEFY
jgi:hypothetical protein